MVSGDWNGKEVQKQGGVCGRTVDSLCSTAESNTALQSNYILIKINLKKKKRKKMTCKIRLGFKQ